MNVYVESAAPPTGLRLCAASLPRAASLGYGAFTVLWIGAAYVCACAGWLQADPDRMDLAAINQLPSAAHWLGTDFVGRDLLARILLGTRAFLLPGLLAVAVSTAGGAALGVLSGYWPARFAAPIGFALQLLESLPKLVLVLLVIALFRPEIHLILAVVGIANIPATAELLRARIAQLRKRSYIEAAVALGLSPARVVLVHVLWLQGRSLLLVQATLGMAEAILIETSLSYLGFGVQEPTPSWGNMVALGKDYFFRGELWISTAPALAILLAILGFHLLGDALRERHEPRGEVH
jgi:peptide/nickel transport system permease protein